MGEKQYNEAKEKKLNETQEILNAFNMKAPVVKKQKTMNEIEPDLTEGQDVITKMAKRQAQADKRKKKPLRKWTMTDFMRYMDECLKNQSLRLERQAPKDRESMAKLYDKFVHVLHDRMDNIVMRDYIDWWVGCFSQSMSDQKIYVGSANNDVFVERFLRRFGSDLEEASDTQHESVPSNVDEQSLYELGGLQMVLMSRGIVCANRVMLKNGEENVFLQISNALRDFAKDVVIDVLQKTLSQAPYAAEDTVDFIALSRPAFKYYDIKKYDSIHYKDYFGR